MSQPLYAEYLAAPYPSDPPPPTAAAFADAALRWRTLSADPQRWTASDGQRELAAAFLRYHAAKLALEEASQGGLSA